MAPRGRQGCNATPPNQPSSHLVGVRRHTLMRTRGGAMAIKEYEPGTAFPGVMGEPSASRRRPGRAPLRAKPGVAQRALHRPRRHRLRAPRLLRLADPDAEPRPAGGRRPALQQHAHHRALLAQPLVHADRPQPPLERDGVHHRGRDRLPGLERPHPVRERLPVRDAAGARLQHHSRSASGTSRPTEQCSAGRALRSLAARARLRALLRLHGRRHAASTTRTSSTTTTRSSRRARPSRAIT